MCMNKSIMSPEFMSGALRSHKLTKFSRGAYSAPQIPSCSYGSLCSPIGPHQKNTHPPPPATRSAYGPVESNPKPNTNTSCICGVCQKQITWEDEGLECDHCHRVSQNMYNILGYNYISWCCINCGLPNLSTGIFNTFNVNSQLNHC